MAERDWVDLTSDDSDFEMIEPDCHQPANSQLRKAPNLPQANVKTIPTSSSSQGSRSDAQPTVYPSWRSYFQHFTDHDSQDSSKEVSEYLAQRGSSQDYPIDIDEDDLDDATRLQALYPTARHPKLRGAENPLAILAHVHEISDDEEESGLEDETAHVIVDENRLKGLLDSNGHMSDGDINRLFPLATPVRSPIIGRHRVQLRPLAPLVLQPGSAVEMKDGSYLYIKQTSRRLGQLFIGGIVLQHPEPDDLILPRRRNEVTWMETYEGEEFLTGDPAKIVFRSARDAVRNRQIVFTNQPWQSLSVRSDAIAQRESVRDPYAVPLFCRWKCITVKESALHTQEQAVIRLAEEEADKASRLTIDGQHLGCRISSAEARDKWRSVATQLGGSQVEVRTVQSIEDSSKVFQEFIKRYSFGDSFCGAGGTSRGALSAGCKVKWGFDMDSRAIRSYSGNFARDGTQCREEAVHTFIEIAMRGGFIVDILHISPPCQPFSAAHTVPNIQRDEQNQAALFSVWQLLEAVKPRVVTIEETEGLITRHETWFKALIHIFLNHDYNVRWKVIKCEHFGVPQTRKRLLIIASGPGEKLPPFPRPTHSPSNPLLKRLVTIGDAIRDIPFNNALHRIVGGFQDGPRTPFSFATLAKTLTCNGGQHNYHPSGLRPYTMREIACLQTFPLCHTFTGAQGLITATRKQIGNAVPPLLAKVLYQSIIKSLRESDADEIAKAAAHHQQSRAA